MAIRGKHSGAVVAMVMAVLVAGAVTGSAQQVPACASKLVPCVAYLNSTSPPESCCGPLRQAAKDDMSCLCELFDDKAILQAFKVDVEQALQLAARCGVSVDRNACSKYDNSTVAASSPSTGPAGPAAPKDQKSAAHGVTWFGMSGMVSLLLFLWSVMA